MSGAPPDRCQVIDSDGAFQEEQLNSFVQQNGVIDARTNYQVVAIMGPQSSGKSTLMNHVVRTVSMASCNSSVACQQACCGMLLLSTCTVSYLVVCLVAWLLLSACSSAPTSKRWMP
jgi:hypothetical protein